MPGGERRPRARRLFTTGSLAQSKTGTEPSTAEREMIVGANRLFPGDPSKMHHRQDDGADYKGYGPGFHSFQIELARWLRLETGRRLNRF